jgi:hypothetical protein
MFNSRIQNADQQGNAKGKKQQSRDLIDDGNISVGKFFAKPAGQVYFQHIGRHIQQ